MLEQLQNILCIEINLRVLTSAPQAFRFSGKLFLNIFLSKPIYIFHVNVLCFDYYKVVPLLNLYGKK